MHSELSIVMRASRQRVFDAAADLSQWPVILPHYRWVRYLERGPGRNVVQMAAWRGWIPIRWTSEQIVDRDRWEVRFRHLKAFTRGMVVMWTFVPVEGGVRVTIVHDLAPSGPVIGRFLVNVIIQRFFIESVAGRTLRHMKKHVEVASVS